MDAFYIILAGSLVAISCGLLGCFLILRNMAMLSDAISHAVLPGIVIVFLLSGSRDQVFMIVGAGIIGVLTTLLIEYLHEKGKLQNDAAIGLTFTFLFAVGVILISLYANQVDLDQECVLYGEIAYLPLDLWITESGFNMGPAPLYLLSIVLILNLVLLYFAYPYFKITGFDPRFALSIGLSVSAWNYLLMAAVSFTTVASFESVGAILVVAFFVVPPATAYLLTNKLSTMLLITVLLAIVISTLGYLAAVWINGSIAGSMAVVSGLLFTAAYSYVQLSKRIRNAGLNKKSLNALTH